MGHAGDGNLHPVFPEGPADGGFLHRQRQAGTAQSGRNRRLKRRNRSRAADVLARSDGRVGGQTLNRLLTQHPISYSIGTILLKPASKWSPISFC